MTANNSSEIFSFLSSSSRAWESSASLLFLDCDCEAKGSSLSFPPSISISLSASSKPEIFPSSVSGLKLGSRLRTLAAERRSPPFLLFTLFVFPFVVEVDLVFFMPDGEVVFGLFVLPLGRPLLFGAEAGVEVDGRGGLNFDGIFVSFSFLFFLLIGFFDGGFLGPLSPAVLLESWASLRAAAVVSSAAGVALLSTYVLLRLRDSYVKAEDGVE